MEAKNRIKNVGRTALLINLSKGTNVNLGPQAVSRKLTATELASPEVRKHLKRKRIVIT